MEHDKVGKVDTHESFIVGAFKIGKVIDTRASPIKAESNVGYASLSKLSYGMNAQLLNVCIEWMSAKDLMQNHDDTFAAGDNYKAWCEKRGCVCTAEKGKNIFNA